MRQYRAYGSVRGAAMMRPDRDFPKYRTGVIGARRDCKVGRLAMESVC